MRDFSVRRALSMMAATWPFIVFRMVVYFGMAAAYVVVTGAGAGIGWGVGAMGDADLQATSAFWGGAIGFGLTAGVLYLLREYILYIVKAGHIAVLVELMDGRPLPEGRGQIAHARTIVTARFAEASVLFALDQLVKGVLEAITGLVRGVLSVLPLPGLPQIMSVVQAFLRLSVGLVDEVILAYAMRTRATNPWESARTGLVLYGQNYKPMLKNAAWLTAIVYGLSLVVFLVMLAPAGAVVYALPGTWSAGAFVFAFIFAWSVKAALIEPFAIACMMQAYFKTIEGQSADPEWEARLDGLSAKFSSLRDKGMAWARGRAGFGKTTQGI